MSKYETAITAFDAIANCSKTAEKSKLINSLTSDHLAVLAAIKNPFIRYGIAKMPENLTPSSTPVDDVLIDDLLDKLSERTLTGNAARDALAELWQQASDKQRDCVQRILTKNSKTGVGITLINKVHKKLIPVFKVNLADKYDPDVYEEGQERIVSPKLDGIRVIARCDIENSKVEWLTREGNVLHSMDHLSDYALIFANVFLSQLGLNTKVIFFDGEGTSGDFTQSVSDLKRHKSAKNAIFNIFDFFTTDDLNALKQQAKYSQRSRLETLDAVNIMWLSSNFYNPAICVHEWAMVDSETDVQQHYSKYVADGHEGVIVKNPDSSYMFARRKNWLKIKGQIDADGTIIGFEAGDKNKQFSDTLGAIVVKLENGVEVKVSSGLSRADRDSIWSNKDEFSGRVIEVLGHEITKDGSIRHPRVSNFPHCLRDVNTAIGDKI